MEDDAIGNQLKTDIEAYKKANNGDDPDMQKEVTLQWINKLDMVMYQCPSDDLAEIKDKFEQAFNLTLRASSYSGVAGSYKSRPGAATCPGAYDANYLKIPCVGPDSNHINIDGMLFPASNVKISRVTDGTSKTLMVGERWYQLRAWTAGSYFGAGGMQGTGIKKSPPATTPINSFSTSAKNISSKYPPNPSLDSVGYYQLHDNNTDRPNMPTGAPKTMTYNDLPFASFHPGIVNFVRADGGSETITDGIDMNIYLALGSRNGDEVVNQQQ
jgi:hypothetical protein